MTVISIMFIPYSYIRVCDTMPVQKIKTTATDQGKGENKRVPNSLFLVRYPRNSVCVREIYTIMTTLKVKKSPSDVEHKEREIKCTWDFPMFISSFFEGASLSYGIARDGLHLRYEGESF